MLIVSAFAARPAQSHDTPCATEMPELEQLRARLAEQGIDLIGVSVDADPEARVAQFAADKKVEYPIYLGGVNSIEQVSSGKNSLFRLQCSWTRTARCRSYCSGFQL